MQMEKDMVREKLVCMVGTDHGLASADVRSAFSLPADVREAVVSLACAKLGATGVVLLATCNRTELWVSFDGVEPPERKVDAQGVPDPDDPLLRMLCEMHMLNPPEYAQYFKCRSGEEAVRHLFQVACGLRSAIMAEDQVVSQVKQAIAFSREIGVADSVLEVLFRQAVTAAKQVKSGVRFTRAYATAVDQAISILCEGGATLEGATCMVIGNGEYGRLAAMTLADHGANVLVTVRQYTHGQVKVPAGCASIPYAQRYEHMNRCQVIMSATTSPHYTIERNQLLEVINADHDGGNVEPAKGLQTDPGRGSDAGNFDYSSSLRLFDLAIPHDIDPTVGDIPGCTLYDIDSFSSEIGTENAAAVESAQRLLASGMDDFWDWVSRREDHAHIRPPAASLFPLFVDLSEKKAVFVGGGTIALRRVRTLLPFAGDITVYAPDFSPELERFAADGTLTLVSAPYDPSMLDGADIVFACTNDEKINDEVHAECKRRGILVNVCSDRYKCDFYYPGVVLRDGIVVGVSAGGKNHRRVRQLCARVDRLFEEEDV